MYWDKCDPHQLYLTPQIFLTWYKKAFQANNSFRVITIISLCPELQFCETVHNCHNGDTVNCKVLIVSCVALRLIFLSLVTNAVAYIIQTVSQ